jgi:hypothetical protein
MQGKPKKKHEPPQPQPNPNAAFYICCQGGTGAVWEITDFGQASVKSPKRFTFFTRQSYARDEISGYFLQEALQLEPLSKSLDPVVRWKVLLSHAEAVAAFCVHVEFD